MASDEPHRAEAARDALHKLEARLDRATDAAERLFAEAADAVGRKPPPAGWHPPSESEPASRDLELLAGVMQSLRDLVPPELQRRLAEALRELLLAVRALIDWYLDRLERGPPAPTEVQDIPIT
jgi:hypothetical protein